MQQRADSHTEATCGRRQGHLPATANWLKRHVPGRPALCRDTFEARQLFRVFERHAFIAKQHVAALDAGGRGLTARPNVSNQQTHVPILIRHLD